MSIVSLDNEPQSARKIQCANCGGQGHVYKNCNHPITSYGIVCFQLTCDKKGYTVPKYLMVQRKDSLSFVEFIRGKYTIEQKAYLMRLISNMTPSERERLRTKTFEDLWKELWLSEDARCFMREFHDAKGRFEMLKKGCIMKNENNELFYFDIDYILNNTTSSLSEPEWGFPKGRRNINEHDLITAMRECKEESGIDPRNVHVINNLKPFEEIFSGTNKVRYRHVYYLGYCSKPKKNLFNPGNKQQSREIKDVKWFTYDNAMKHIRPHNVERRELLKRIHNIIMKNACTPYTQVPFTHTQVPYTYPQVPYPQIPYTNTYHSHVQQFPHTYPMLSSHS